MMACLNLKLQKDEQLYLNQAKIRFYELTTLGSGLKALLQRDKGVPITVRKKDRFERVLKTGLLCSLSPSNDERLIKLKLQVPEFNLATFSSRSFMV